MNTGKPGVWILTGLMVMLWAGALGAMPRILHYQGRVSVDGIHVDGTGFFKFALVEQGEDISSQATATARITDWNGGSIEDVMIGHWGYGYFSPPNVWVVSGSGLGAVLEAEVMDGMVHMINIIEPGSGYQPHDTTVMIDPPESAHAYTTLWSNDYSSWDGSEPMNAVELAVTKGLFSVMLGDDSIFNMYSIDAQVFEHEEIYLRVWFDDGVNGAQLLSPSQRLGAAAYAMKAGTVPDGAITSDKIAHGAVGSGQLATASVYAVHITSAAIHNTHLMPNVVTADKIADGAVGAGHIAPGSIDSSHLVKAPRSGTVDSGSLHIQFNQSDVAVPFSPAFAASPIVTLGLGISASGAWPLTAWVVDSNQESFNGRIAVAVDPVVVDRPGYVPRGSMTLVKGHSQKEVPAIAYVDYGDFVDRTLYFVRAKNREGTLWHEPVEIASGNIDQPSMVIPGQLPWATKPVIAYRADDTVLYVQAENEEGTLWHAPVVVDPGSSSSFPDMIAYTVDSVLIAYNVYDPQSGTSIKVAELRGGGFSVLLSVPGASYPRLCMVDGEPAVIYSDGWNLAYRRKNVGSGTWSAPVTIAANGNSDYCSMAVVNGRPSVAYRGLNDTLMFVRANDAQGQSWGVPLELDEVSGYSLISMQVPPSGPPSVLYGDSAVGMQFVGAIDADATQWAKPVTIVNRWNTSFFLAFGYNYSHKPIISFFGESSKGEGLHFLPPPVFPDAFSVNWIAIEP